MNELTKQGLILCAVGTIKTPGLKLSQALKIRKSLNEKLESHNDAITTQGLCL
jgi:hypothetical protein